MNTSGLVFAESGFAFFSALLILKQFPSPSKRHLLKSLDLTFLVPGILSQIAVRPRMIGSVNAGVEANFVQHTREQN